MSPHSFSEVNNTTPFLGKQTSPPPSDADGPPLASFSKQNDRASIRHFSNSPPRVRHRRNSPPVANSEKWRTRLLLGHPRQTLPPDTLEWKRSWWKTHNNGRTAAQRKYIHSIDEMNLCFSHHSGPINRSGLNPVQLLTLDLNKDNYGNRIYDTMKMGPNILRPALTIPSVGRTDGRSAGRTVNRSDGRSRADGLI